MSNGVSANVAIPFCGYRVRNLPDSASSALMQSGLAGGEANQDSMDPCQVTR